MAPLKPPVGAEGPLRDFHAALYDLYLQAGAPSVRQISRALGPGELSHDTVYRVLTRPTLPTWASVEAIVSALRGDTGHFLTLWRQCLDLTNEEPLSAETPPPATDHLADGAPKKVGPLPTARSETVDPLPNYSTFLDLLSTRTRAALMAVATERTYLPGDSLSVQGDTARHVLLIVSGYAKEAVHGLPGYSALINVLGPGEIYGELQALQVETVRPTGLTATTHVRARIVQGNQFAQLSAAVPELQRAIISTIAAQLRRSNQLRLDYRATAGERISRNILFLAKRYGIANGEFITVNFPISNAELASLSGTALPTLEKHLMNMRNSGVITKNYRRISVLDMETLNFLAGERENDL